MSNPTDTTTQPVEQIAPNGTETHIANQIKSSGESKGHSSALYPSYFRLFTPPVHTSNHASSPFEPFDRDDITVPECLFPSSTPKRTIMKTARLYKPVVQSNQHVLPAASRIRKEAPRGKTPNRRGRGFGEAETKYLLQFLDLFLPLCIEECGAVLREHILHFAQSARTVEGLRKRFATLHRK